MKELIWITLLSTSSSPQSSLLMAKTAWQFYIWAWIVLEEIGLVETTISSIPWVGPEAQTLILLMTLFSLNFHIPVTAADVIAKVLRLLPKVAANQGV